jgi:hypothetical protein
MCFTFSVVLCLQDALLPLLFNFTLEHVIRRIQVKQDGLKLNDIHQLPVYADDVNILGESIHTVKKNTLTLVVARKETVLEVNWHVSRSGCRTKLQYRD